MNGNIDGIIVVGRIEDKLGSKIKESPRFTLGPHIIWTKLTSYKNKELNYHVFLSQFKD